MTNKEQCCEHEVHLSYACPLCKRDGLEYGKSLSHQREQESWESAFDEKWDAEWETGTTMDGDGIEVDVAAIKSFIRTLLERERAEAVDAWVRKHQPITDFHCSKHEHPIPACFQCFEEARNITNSKN